MLRIFSKKEEPQSDAALVAHYQQTGDQVSLSQLYERYIELVYGLCLKYFKDEGLAQDAVINIYEELVKKVKAHEIKQFKSWLHVLARNHCLMQLRKKKITINFDPDLMQSVDLRHHNNDSEDVEEREEQLQGLEDCIAGLAEEQKACIELFYLQGKTYKDIASQHNMQIGKVRSFIQNGRRNLKICMERKVLKGEE
ncbi:MAG: sigma-70 family RNA polymerase sigma factor [Saprospiraceae bacterium]|nr:sigma-70 family RNA polymerase sigma factor [Saprospiraceae bacterium]